jgi:hypothetical protein
VSIWADRFTLLAPRVDKHWSGSSKFTVFTSGVHGFAAIPFADPG